MKNYNEEDIKCVCRILENRLRRLGKDCQVIFCDDGVSVAPPEWGGDSFGDTLYDALLDAEK